MRIPNLEQMIEKVESEKALLSIESIVRGIADLSLGLYTIESCLRLIETRIHGTTLELGILDTIENHTYQKKGLNIHNAVCSLLLEIIRNSDIDMQAAFRQYFISGGPFPYSKYVVDIETLYAAILKIRRENYVYPT